MSLTLTDQASRTRIETDLGAQLFVQAGAGSGKTHELVARICALVASGEPLAGIAAITFTEKAAAELRERVRSTLEDPTTVLDPEQRANALDQLDTAPIGTIHSFATRILSENPIDAGLPPLLEVADELRSRIAFARRWESARAALFTDEQASAALEVLLALGATIANIESVARELDSAWDRLDPTPLAEQSLPTMPTLDLMPVLNTLAAVLECAPQCTNPAEDKLFPKFAVLEAWRAKLVEAWNSGDLADAFELLTHPPLTNIHWGTPKNWSLDLAALKADLKELKDTTVPQTVLSVVGPAIARVTAVLASVLVVEARVRQRSGQLEFHDLLVHCRDLLADPSKGDVRRRIHDRYPRIMLDEFQDTDPLQAEIAIRIAANPRAGDAATDADWRDLEPPAGRLFMVGDPKQSIYRFRRADIATYLQQQERSVASDARSVVSLTTNFRSTQPVLDWINHVFADLIAQDGLMQPAYEALVVNPARPAWNDEFGPAVSVLGASADDIAACAEMKSPEKREREAADIAAVIQAATGRGGSGAWMKESPGGGAFVQTPVELQDICILIPSRTSLHALESALDRAGIEYMAEASSLVYSTQEVHDLLLTLRALANTADEAALGLALRTPLFGCGDDDLLTWKTSGQRWNFFGTPPANMTTHPVALAFTYLKQLHRALPTSSPADLLTRLIVDRRTLEATTDGPRYRDVWRRLRFVVDQAEAWSEATQGSLREYLTWATSQQEDNARVNESVVPETGLNAVRITTIHASKGRQFPVVILAGSSGDPRSGSSSVLWDDDGRLQVRFRSGIETGQFAALASLEGKFIEAERRRLLYVACTRAESHLVVSLYSGNARSFGALLAAAHDETLSTPFHASEATPSAPARRPVRVGPLPEWPEWLTQRTAWELTSQVAASTSVTSLAKGAQDAAAQPWGPLSFTDPAGAELALPAFAGGGEEHGTRLGTAVHKVVELSRLVVDESLTTLAGEVAQAHELTNPALLESMARSALRAEPVARAADREHWLELPFAAAADGQVPNGTVMEGVADLVYREDDGSLVIVDFKTDVGLSAKSMDAYWRQLTIYANLIHGATGQPVSELALVFCRADPAQVFRQTAAG